MLTGMWVLLSSRLRTWLLLTVAVPLAATVARRLARRIESRHGETKVSRSLYKASDLVSRNRRDEVSEQPRRRGVAALRRR
jgi:hypothetical protein